MNAGLANNIAHGQAQRDVGVDDRAEQQRPSIEVEYHGGPLSEVFDPPDPVEYQRATTKIECHGGPVSEVSGPPEATASLARGGLPLQAHHQRRLQPPSGTLLPPTTIISDSDFEQWLPSGDMKMPMFSLSEGPQQSAPTEGALAAAAPAAEAVTSTRVSPAASSKGVAEAPGSSAVAAASEEILVVEPAISGTVPSAASIRGAVGGRESFTGAVSSDAEAEATPSTRGTVAPVASAARAARKLVSAAGSTGEICGERGASTHPFNPGIVFPLEVRYSSDGQAKYNSSGSSSSSSSSSNDKTSDHDSWWDATYIGVLLRPFDPGKQCWRMVRRGKAVLGVDLPFDRGKAWGRM